MRVEKDILKNMKIYVEFIPTDDHWRCSDNEFKAISAQGFGCNMLIKKIEQHWVELLVTSSISEGSYLIFGHVYCQGFICPLIIMNEIFIANSCLKWHIFLINLKGFLPPPLPYSRLYWTEDSDLGHRMFYCSISNHTLHHVLQPKASNLSGRSQCSCNVIESELGGAMTVDTSDPNRPRIYFTKGQEIWAMDLEGCQCWKITMVPAILGNVQMHAYIFSSSF